MRERKRHTDRGVSSTVLSYPGGEGGRYLGWEGGRYLEVLPPPSEPGQGVVPWARGEVIGTLGYPRFLGVPPPPIRTWPGGGVGTLAWGRYLGVPPPLPPSTLGTSRGGGGRLATLAGGGGG